MRIYAYTHIRIVMLVVAILQGFFINMSLKEEHSTCFRLDFSMLNELGLK